jgi:acyl-CoA thioesterase
VTAEALHPLDADLRLEPDGEGRWRAEVTERWWIFQGPYGGYLSALLARAVRLAVDDPARPLRSLSVHFLAAPAAGPVALNARVERAGRSSTTVSARLEQDGVTMALALAGCGTWREGDPEWADAAMPPAPAPEACDPVEPGAGMPAFLGQLDVRFVSGGPGARNLAWVRPRPARPLDVEGLVLVADTWMPAAMTRLGPPLIVPTFDLTVHVRAQLPPSEDWLLIAFASRFAAGGAWEEDGDLWSRDGRLLAQSRQLAMIREQRA